jgi:hypothetical protein
MKRGSPRRQAQVAYRIDSRRANPASDNADAGFFAARRGLSQAGSQAKQFVGGRQQGSVSPTGSLLASSALAVAFFYVTLASLTKAERGSDGEHH